MCMTTTDTRRVIRRASAMQIKEGAGRLSRQPGNFLTRGEEKRGSGGTAGKLLANWGSSGCKPPESACAMSGCRQVSCFWNRMHIHGVAVAFFMRIHPTSPSLATKTSPSKEIKILGGFFVGSNAWSILSRGSIMALVHTC